MLTRRENLLVRPWQQRRYNQHRHKVVSALPAIDVGPPPERTHVTCKLKQIQREGERCARIDRDNCRLVQRLAHIMRTSRVDNCWRDPPPTFLHRVGIYMDPAAPSASCPASSRGSLDSQRNRLSQLTSQESKDSQDSQESEGRNLRCSACHPRTARRKDKRQLRRLSGRQNPPQLEQGQQDQGETGAKLPQEEQPDPQQLQVVRRRRGASMSTVPGSGRSPRRRALSPLHQVVITYEALRLAVSFPPHASVRVHSAGSVRELRKGPCACVCGSRRAATATPALDAGSALPVV